MRFQLNLSRQPFHNRKLFWIGFLLIATGMTFAGRWTLQKIEETDAVARRLQESINEHKRNFKIMRSGQDNKTAALLTPEQVKQIEVAAILIDQRRFSWTAMLEEFERAMPRTIRVAAIGLKNDKNSQESEDEGTILSVRLYAKSEADVTQMIAEMDKHKIFHVEPKSQTINPGSDDIGFDLEVAYTPVQHPEKDKKDKPAAEKKKKKASEDDLAKGDDD